MNDLILEAMKKVPSGGGYSVGRRAFDHLTAAVALKDGRLAVEPRKARPSFCSGATYQVFLLAFQAWNKKHHVELSPALLRQLQVTGQPDGVGVWGRWNANGPGTGRLFRELEIGVNFQDEELARPGDFLKLWWNEHVGQKESGHSVIFVRWALAPDGKTRTGVRFWSSNLPGGYGEKTVPLAKVKRMLFSRITHPTRLAEALPSLPERDQFLAEMLTRPCDEREFAQKTGLALP